MPAAAGLSVVAPSVDTMEHGLVMLNWRTVYCTSCRRERRHYTNHDGEVCSWCGTVREQARQPEYGTSVRQSASS